MINSRTRYARNIAAVLLSAFLSITIAAAARAEDSSSQTTKGKKTAENQAPAFFRVPVFFVTDRNEQKTKTGDIDFGGYRKYIGDCKHDPFMGKAYSVIPNYEHKQLNEYLRSLGWADADPKEKFRDFKVDLIKGTDFDAIQNEFYKELHDRTALSKDKNFYLFAHGYKNTFQSALGTAGRLAYYAERPVVLYSWPSAARLRAYNCDENNVEWSQEHYNDVLRRVEQLCTDDPETKVRVFAHSMGSRLVIRATPLLRERHHVLEVALICPDVDDGLVKHYARRYLSVNGTCKIRLYMSTRDKALAISQLVHGGYTRLGEQADAIGDWINKTIAGEKAEASAEDSKQSEAEFQQRLEKTKTRMQTIDFTSIDKGLLGHNVPAPLITSMSFTDSPPPGMHFDTEASGKRGKMSNLFTKLTKLNKLDGTSALTGAVLKVELDGAPQNGSKKIANDGAAKNSKGQAK